MTDIAYLTAHELTARYEKRQLSSVEVKHFADASVLWLAERFERIQPFVVPPALEV
ncbi:MAG TPA: hypothetical protein VFN67_07430 [Polyangiales bacterium]|nr:hypothetical protein [Polyangiales bacterium]